MGDEVDFLPADKHKSFLLCSQAGPKHQNKQFTILLQYLMEDMKDEVDFSPADKCWRFFQLDTIILGMCGQACPIT